jgi:hypothetical protein
MGQATALELLNVESMTAEMIISESHVSNFEAIGRTKEENFEWGRSLVETDTAQDIKNLSIIPL